VLLEHKVAIVSGIGPGMGQHIALRLAREGADLVIGGRTPEKLEAVAKELRALGRRVVSVIADIAKPGDCRALADRAISEFGGVDVLVNNAYHGGTMTPFESDDLEKWRTTLEVNLYGSLRLTQNCVPSMVQRGGGSVVMISTMSTRVVNPGFVAYGASKAALNAATQGLARELGPKQVRVNAVLPGYIWGDPVKGFLERQAAQQGRAYEQVHSELCAQIPLRRVPTPEEISGAVLFFASPLSSCITGQLLDVNGGHVMY
jgi:NAD(P)-dependent dehydrogenase (short-subunit alcohol dehydrogenase family)